MKLFSSVLILVCLIGCVPQTTKEVLDMGGDKNTSLGVIKITKRTNRVMRTFLYQDNVDEIIWEKYKLINKTGDGIVEYDLGLLMDRLKIDKTTSHRRLFMELICSVNKNLYFQKNKLLSKFEMVRQLKEKYFMDRFKLIGLINFEDISLVSKIFNKYKFKGGSCTIDFNNKVCYYSYSGESSVKVYHFNGVKRTVFFDHLENLVSFLIHKNNDILITNNHEDVIVRNSGKEIIRYPTKYGILKAVILEDTLFLQHRSYKRKHFSFKAINLLINKVIVEKIDIKSNEFFKYIDSFRK